MSTYLNDIFLRAEAEMNRAIDRFPQPNYVLLKVAEESGEVVKAAVHYAEGLGSWEDVEGEAVQAIAMIARLLTEGDQKNGIIPKARLDRSGRLPNGYTVEEGCHYNDKFGNRHGPIMHGVNGYYVEGGRWVWGSNGLCMNGQTGFDLAAKVELVKPESEPEPEPEPEIVATPEPWKPAVGMVCITRGGYKAGPICEDGEDLKETNFKFIGVVHDDGPEQLRSWTEDGRWREYGESRLDLVGEWIDPEPVQIKPPDEITTVEELLACFAGRGSCSFDLEHNSRYSTMTLTVGAAKAVRSYSYVTVRDSHDLHARKIQMLNELRYTMEKALSDAE